MLRNTSCNTCFLFWSWDLNYVTSVKNYIFYRYSIAQYSFYVNVYVLCMLCIICILNIFLLIILFICSVIILLEWFFGGGVSEHSWPSSCRLFPLTPRLPPPLSSPVFAEPTGGLAQLPSTPPAGWLRSDLLLMFILASCLSLKLTSPPPRHKGVLPSLKFSSLNVCIFVCVCVCVCC